MAEFLLYLLLTSSPQEILLNQVEQGHEVKITVEQDCSTVIIDPSTALPRCTAFYAVETAGYRGEGETIEKAIFSIFEGLLEEEKKTQ